MPPVRLPLPSETTSDWLRLIADTLPAYIAYIDAGMVYRMINRTYEVQFNVRAKDIVGRPVADVLGPYFGNVSAHLYGALAGVTQNFTTVMKSATEGERVLAVTHVPDRDEMTGEIRGIIVHGVDFTERYRENELLRQSEDRFRTLMERSSIGINIGNEQGELSYMNPALLATLGYTNEELERGDVRWDELTPTQFLARDREALAELAATGKAKPYEKLYRAKDGRLIPMLLGAAYIPSIGDDTRQDIAVFFTDLSLQKSAEAALRQNEKLAAVGKLASSISHELNNPLEAVTNLLYLIGHDDTLSPTTRGYLETAERELARMAQIATQTLRFHRQSTVAQTIDPAGIVEEVLTIYGPQLENTRITVLREFSPALQVTCYESEVRQVLSNLVVNAIDAMRPHSSPAAGKCKLRVRTRAATKWLTGEPGIRVTVADNAGGMPAEVAARIFEAFFTTKGISGTGLGLWISQRIAHKHGGHLSVRSSRKPSHHGTVFTLWLPESLSATTADLWHTDGIS